MAPAVVPTAVVVTVAVTRTAVAGTLEIVARVAGRIAVAAEPLDHPVEVPLGVLDAFAAVFPTLRLRRSDRYNR